MYLGISLCRGEYIGELPSGVANALVDYFLLQWGMTLSLQWGMTVSAMVGNIASVKYFLMLYLHWRVIAFCSICDEVDLCLIYMSLKAYLQLTVFPSVH